MASLISIGHVLDLGLEHTRKHVKALLAIILWIVVASIPSIVGKLLAVNGDTAVLTGGDWLSFALSLFGAVLVAIVSLWMYVTLIIAIEGQATNQTKPLKYFYRQGAKAFVNYLILTLMIIGLILALLLFAVPGYTLLFLSGTGIAAKALTTIGTPLFLVGVMISLYLLVKYTVQLAFAPYILLLEKTSPKEAIKASLNLVKGQWWATCLRFALPKLVYFLAMFVASFVIFSVIEILLAFLINTSPFLVVIVYTLSLFLSVLLSVIVTPLIIASDYYLYASLRKIK